MPTAPGYASCSLEMKHATMSRSAFITFGCNPVDTDPSAVAASLATAATQAGSLGSCIDSNVTWIAARASLGTDGSEDLVGVYPMNIPCTLSASTLPANCAMLVHKLTARGGRRGRGRFYIPWTIGTSTITEAGGVIASDVARVQAAVEVWAGQVNTLVGPVVLLHRPSEPGIAHPSSPGAPNVVTGYRADPLVATQRRRLGR